MSEKKKKEEKIPKKKRGRKPKEKDSKITEIEVEIIDEDAVEDGISPEETVIAEGIFKDLMPKVDILPKQLGIISVQHRPLFPHMVIPLVVEGELYQKTIKYALKSEPGYVGIVLGTSKFNPSKPNFAGSSFSPR